MTKRAHSFATDCEVLSEEVTTRQAEEVTTRQAEVIQLRARRSQLRQTLRALRKSIERTDEMLRLVDQAIQERCEHEWHYEYQYERPEQVCNTCGAYRDFLYQNGQ